MTKRNKIINIALIIIVLVLFIVIFNNVNPKDKSKINNDKDENIVENQNSKKAGDEEKKAKETKNNSKEEEEQKLPTMAIESLREGNYTGGDFKIEETLSNGTNYKRFLASYKSEGLKINGLLTVPLVKKPENGFPAVIFIHGYIPPKLYSTINSYPTYQASLAKAGFVTFKPDLRGHDDSEGEPVSSHSSEKYVIDTLNAIEYLKDYEGVDASRIGYWGHSNGGEIGLRVVLINKEIKAASFWAGVVGSYEDMYETYVDKIPFLEQERNPLIRQYGLPSQNNQFWSKIEPYNYLEDIDIPIEIQHGTEDKSVPIVLSYSLRDALQDQNKEVIFHEYRGDNHNIGINSSKAWGRTIEFFREEL